ncbi:XrtV sorting system accessory protein [Sphingobium subterraneum]|uniref:Uncharacterized protein n=1 Tax=Sphingobium subterraneum TaxID=627688 RepID=A0A841IYP3_9SPHN|nr:XrtV sorting system accessory protein [Sphingobium subterraneum]MBB6123252.1 hypothetical protein [Sphingobium subterraneum]
METVFDWVTLALFAGLIVLFLQRSSEEQPRDSLWQYLLPASGCGLANYVGNEGHEFLAVAIIGAIVAFVLIVLRPFAAQK